MNSRSQNAKNLFLQGYNCSQAVVLSYSDILKQDKNTLALLSSSFGGGMGRLREVCGAVSGMFIVIGLLYGYSDPKATTEKKNHYKRIQELANSFKTENSSIICRELLELQQKGASNPTPEARTVEYYRKRPCPELVECAVEILNKYISENPYK